MKPESLQKLPPHNPELEAAFLGCVLLGGATAIMDVLPNHPELGDYFYDIRHKTTFSAIYDLVEAWQPVDLISVRSLLLKRDQLQEAGGDNYLTRLPDAGPVGGAAGYYADQLRELFIKRRTLAACVKVEAAAWNGVNTSELLETVERELNGICSENTPSETSMRDLVSSAIDEIEFAHANKGKPHGLTTGLSDLDRLTHGLRAGQLIVIGAGTSAGKTSLAINIVEHVAIDCKKPVGVIELEMTAKELTLRLISCRSEVPMERLLSGELAEADFHSMARANAAISKAPIHIADQGGITISQLRAIARRMHRKHKLSLLVVDYLQLVRPSRANASRNVEVAEVSSSLKALAKELEVPLIALSQLNRDSDAESREPRLRDLRDSGSIEQDADIVGLLHRPKPEARLVELNIAKHRQGPRRKLKLVFFGETFRFRMAEGDEP